MNKIHKEISFWNHPIISLKDIIKTGGAKPQLYILSLFPIVITLFSLFADFISVFGINVDNLKLRNINEVTIILIILLFVYGIINILLATALQKTTIRLGREQEWHDFFHKQVIEPLRDYRAQKENDLIAGLHTINSNQIRYQIHTILDNLTRNIICRVHRKGMNACIKFVFKDKLCSIRAGDSEHFRNVEVEPKESSVIFDIFSQCGKNTRQYIYIKNLDKLEKDEEFFFGEKIKDRYNVLKERAGDHYKTFVAMPIRGGADQRKSNTNADDNKWAIRDLIGIIGFDSKESYAFGDLPEHELDFLACFADTMSELVYDLIQQLGIEAESKEKSSAKKLNKVK